MSFICHHGERSLECYKCGEEHRAREAEALREERERNAADERKRKAKQAAEDRKLKAAYDRGYADGMRDAATRLS